MSSKYFLEKTEIDKKWDAFVQSSPNGTVFSLSDYLHSIKKRKSAYYCYKNKEVHAAVIVLENSSGDILELHDFVIYNGILFRAPLKDQNRSQVHSSQFDIASFIAGRLPMIYHQVVVQLHVSICDIRPFLWVNYGTKLPKYRVDVRYTSYVDISGCIDPGRYEENALFHQFSASRRQEIRYGRKKGVKTLEEFQPDLFVDFYSKTMLRQKVAIYQDNLKEMKTLMMNLFENGLAKMFVSYTSAGDPGSMAFFCFDNRRAYYLFGANDPDLREEHTGSLVIWDAFFVLRKMGITQVDLEGINSPNRGWFKLSFGGDIRPYYRLTLEQ